MKQFPNKLKFKKYHKLNFFYSKSFDKTTFFLSKGQYGIQSLQFGKLQFKHIESCRRTIKRGLKKLGFLWINLFTNIPITKKSIATRMGKGKGNLAYWIAPIKKGQILFEVSGFNFKKIIHILFKSKNKLPIKTKITKLIY
jgi:large subunit ribosomal protein L16